MYIMCMSRFENERRAQGEPDRRARLVLARVRWLGSPDEPELLVGAVEFLQEQEDELPRVPAGLGLRAWPVRSPAWGVAAAWPRGQPESRVAAWAPGAELRWAALRLAESLAWSGRRAEPWLPGRREREPVEAQRSSAERRRRAVEPVPG